MFVRDYMKTQVVTVPNSMSVHDAQKLMRENGIRGLPVEDNDKLTGFITQEDLSESAAWTPSPSDIPDLLDFLYCDDLADIERWQPQDTKRISSVMRTDVTTVSPDTLVEDALSLAEKHQITTLPVIDEDDRLLGIVSASHLYRAIMQALEYSSETLRLYIYEHPKPDRPFSEIFDIIHDRGGRIFSLLHVLPSNTDRTDCLIHLEIEDVTALLDDLADYGYSAEVKPPSMVMPDKKKVLAPI